MRTTRLYTAHATHPGHLGYVTAEMRRRGAPTIRVVDCGDHYVALEGVHRLAAAADLGLAPILDVLAQDDPVATASLDVHGLAEGETYRAGEVARELYHPGSGCYAIEPDGRLRLVHAAAAWTAPADEEFEEVDAAAVLLHGACRHCGGTRTAVVVAPTRITTPDAPR